MKTETSAGSSKKKKRSVKYYAFEGVRKIIMLIALCVFTYSCYQLANIYLDYQDGDEAYGDMEEQFLIPNIVASNDADEVETDMYGNEITAGTEVAEFKFDYDALLALNSSALGWIKLDDVLSYPIVQGMDNTYYLTHNVAHQKNKNGAIFVDYRVIGGLDAQNCIIYGHDMLNDSMFGSLLYYQKESYYKEHKTFEIYVGKDLYKYHVFATYLTDAVGYTYSYNFQSNEEYEAYIKDCLSRRLYDTDVGENVTVNDKIITLSTCERRTSDRRFIVQLVRGEKVEE